MSTVLTTHRTVRVRVPARIGKAVAVWRATSEVAVAVPCEDQHAVALRERISERSCVDAAKHAGRVEVDAATDLGQP